MAGPAWRAVMRKSLTPSLSTSPTMAPVCSVDGPGAGRSPCLLESFFQVSVASSVGAANAVKMMKLRMLNFIALLVVELYRTTHALSRDEIIGGGEKSE